VAISPQKSKTAKGKNYENLAAEYLIENGYRILERNWRTGHLEIDVIAAKDKTIIFVEVKSSQSDKFGHPSERINPKKKNNLYRAAQNYIIDKNLDGYDFRFDAITFWKGKLEYYPDAFQLGEE
jgi:putative endonuclease